MRTHLSVKFFLSYILVGLATFILTSTLGASQIQKNLYQETCKDLYKIVVRLSHDIADDYPTTDHEIEDLHHNLAVLGDSLHSEIWLISPSGEVILNSSKEDLHERSQIDHFNPVDLGSDFYTEGSFFDYFPDSRLTVMVPVIGNLEIRSYLTIHYDPSLLTARRESILKTFHLLFLMISIMVLAVLIFLFLTVNRPLRRITQGAKEYASGNMGYQISVRNKDELGYLAEMLNYMSDEIGKSGEYQRKFIANVSHDFRSPLTSIKGYAEAILDGTIPVEMQDRYLKIVLNEAERLNKLTRELLTLNNIDNRGFYLNLTRFNINQTLRDTAAAFEGICTEKRIQIELVLAEDPMDVQADYGRIQQVLYNLLDNAIKFSPNASSIQMETNLRHDKVIVSVKDHGMGIPKESINKIWERFYKIDASRGKDKKGTGLGLSIVKEIIAAHGQKIDVISTEGAGTEFLFTLPLAK